MESDRNLEPNLSNSFFSNIFTVSTYPKPCFIFLCQLPKLIANLKAIFTYRNNTVNPHQARKMLLNGGKKH